MARYSSLTRFIMAAALAAGMLTFPAAAVASAQSQVFISDHNVKTWDPIIPATAYLSWPTTVCKPTPAVGLDAAWTNPHNAFTRFTNPSTFGAHPWEGKFNARWINAWEHIGSKGPGGHSWTKYSTEVSGDGNFQLQLIADNCSWVFIDGVLVGFQEAIDFPRKYPVTLKSTELGRPQVLEFIIFDGGGAAGGMFRLETTTDQNLFKDTDGDGLTDTAEKMLHGTFPDDPDSDNDGHSDGDEVAAGTNPLVFDAPADSTPPVITPVVTGTGNGDWYNSNVGVSWTVTDLESDATYTCPDQTVTTDTAGTTFTCTASSAGGTSTGSVTLKRDTTPPVVTPTVNGTQVNGWYTSSVTIAWSVSETLSPVTSSGCTATTVSADTTGATYTCSATSAGGTTSQSVTIKRDTTGPSIASATPSQVMLWEPNHKMVPISVTVATSDAGAGGVVCEIGGVSSSEGGNQHEPDVQLTGPLTVNLRAERDGKNTGRTYTIQISCKDAAGNKSSTTTTVGVPHDQGKKK